MCPDLRLVPSVLSLLERKTKIATSFFQMGVPFNDINRRLGLGFPEGEWGQKGWLPVNMAPPEKLEAMEKTTTPAKAKD